MIAYVFAGQGSQKEGMGADLSQSFASAHDLYKKAEKLLGKDLLTLRSDELQQTQWAQLAIVTHSLAAYAALQSLLSSQAENPALFAGFSLGEYSMLAAAKCLPLESLLELVAKRALYMQEACEKNPGAMHAVLGLETEVIQGVLSRPDFRDSVWLANDNAPGQTVIAGREKAAMACAQALQECGARRIVKLQVGGAFHTPLMQEAAEKLENFARSLQFRPASDSAYSNVDGQKLKSPLDFPAYLARQMVSPVRWVKEVETMHQDGADGFMELGAGKVLTGLIRKIVKGQTPLAVQDEASVRQAAKWFEGKAGAECST